MMFTLMLTAIGAFGIAFGHITHDIIFAPLGGIALFGAGFSLGLWVME